MSFRAVSRILGRLLLLLAVAELLPALCSALYREEAALVFLASAAVAGLAAALFAFVGRGAKELYRREGILIVVGGWALASLFGSLPYLWTGTVMHPVDAIFESASGFTTTGASILTDIESCGRGILFWRSFTQWLGGMGIIVLFVALLPELGPGARFLYKLEVPGPTAEVLSPRVRDTALILWKIYLLLTVAETVCLRLAGLDLYDSLTHTFSTLSTGGFSPRNASVAAFGSPLVELVIIVFMVLAGANFSLYYGLRMKGGLRVLKDPELRLYILIIAVGTAVIATDLLARGVHGGISRTILDSLFQVVSILTTTGFATADFDTWPHFSRVLLVVLMFVGGCAGSTAGSMKVMRMVVGLKAAARELQSVFSPNRIARIFVGGKMVPEGVVQSVWGFFILFLFAWAVGTIVLAAGGSDLETAASASIAVLGNVGPGLSGVGPTHNFSQFSHLEKLVMVFLMWLGRLEVYAVAALLTRRFWRA